MIDMDDYIRESTMQKLIQVYPYQVEMAGPQTARVTVHDGQTMVVIYLTGDEVVELGGFRDNDMEPLPDWFRQRVTMSVIDQALRSIQ
jgi:hypothetical protein